MKTESELQSQRRWRLGNREHIRLYQRAYRQSHELQEKARRKRRYQENIRYRLGQVVASCIYQSLRGNKAGRHWEGLVGWKLEELVAHLKRQFVDGMSWGNYGEWHIDHRVPIVAFNFTRPSDFDFKRCWALDNLQPLWANDNLSKAGKVANPFQPSLISD